jgi:hypothetical protein
MKKLGISLFLLVVLGTASVAQQAATPHDAPSKADVLRFLDLMQIRARLEQMMEGMKNGMKTGAEAGFKAKIPDATPAQLEKVDAFANVVFQDFPLDEMIDAVIPIYQKHLTKSDLDAVVAFYSSPVGQRLLKEQPAMMAEGMQAGQDIMLRRLPELGKRIDTKVAQLADEEMRRSAPGKKTTSQ